MKPNREIAFYLKKQTSLKRFQKIYAFLKFCYVNKNQEPLLYKMRIENSFFKIISGYYFI